MRTTNQVIGLIAMSAAVLVGVAIYDAIEGQLRRMWIPLDDQEIAREADHHLGKS